MTGNLSANRFLPLAPPLTGLSPAHTGPRSARMAAGDLVVGAASAPAPAVDADGDDAMTQSQTSPSDAGSAAADAAFHHAAGLLGQVQDVLASHSADAVSLLQEADAESLPAPLTLLCAVMHGTLATWIEIARHHDAVLRRSFPDFLLAARLTDATAVIGEMRSQLDLHTELTAAMRSLRVADGTLQQCVVRTETSVTQAITITRDTHSLLRGLPTELVKRFAGTPLRQTAAPTRIELPAAGAPLSALGLAPGAAPTPDVVLPAGPRKRALFTDPKAPRPSGAPGSTVPPAKKAKVSLTTPDQPPVVAPDGSFALVVQPGSDWHTLAGAASLMAHTGGAAHFPTTISLAKEFEFLPKAAKPADQAAAPAATAPTPVPPAGPAATPSPAPGGLTPPVKEKKRTHVVHYHPPLEARRVLRVNYSTPVATGLRVALTDVVAAVALAHAAVGHVNGDDPAPVVESINWHVRGSHLDVTFAARPATAVIDELARNHRTRFGDGVLDLGFYIPITQLLARDVVCERPGGERIPFEVVFQAIRDGQSAAKGVNAVVASNLLLPMQHPRPEYRNVVGGTGELLFAIYDDADGSRARSLEKKSLLIGGRLCSLAIHTPAKCTPQCAKCLMWGHHVAACRAKHQHCTLCHLPHPEELHDTYCVECSPERERTGSISVQCPRTAAHLSCGNCGCTGHGPRDGVCTWAKNAFDASWMAAHPSKVSVTDLEDAQRRRGGSRDVQRGKRKADALATRLADRAAGLGITDDDTEMVSALGAASAVPPR